MKKKVVHVVSQLNIGGAETNLYNTLRYFDTENFDIYIIVHGRSKGTLEKKFEEINIKVFHIRKYKLINKNKYLKDFENVMETVRPDIVHFHIRVETVILSKLLIEMGKDIKIVSHSHSTSEGKGLLPFIKKMHYKNITNFTDLNIACSQLAGRWMFGDEFEILYNSINVDEFKFDSSKRDALRKRYGIEGKFVLGHIGSFKKVKNQEFLIKVLEILRKKSNNFCLIMIGTGEDFKKIENIIETKNLQEHVLMLGEIANIADYYNMFDLFLLPSLYEGLPMVLIEAQANGLFSLVSDTVTSEIKVESQIEFLPLIENRWASKIEQISIQQRYLRKIIKKENFNLFNAEYNAKILAKFYERILGL